MSRPNDDVTFSDSFDNGTESFKNPRKTLKRNQTLQKLRSKDNKRFQRIFNIAVISCRLCI